MVTKSKSEEELLGLVTERLADGFEGFRRMFKDNDPTGGDSVTPDALLRIMYHYVGFMSPEKFDKFLHIVGLQDKDNISFDLFVSRFKEYKDIQKQWMPLIQREECEKNLSEAHPEEHLRDCSPPNEWKQLKVAPHAVHLLKKHLYERRIDLRSLLPDECYKENGVVDKIQMRIALKQLGINLTDFEYKKFWDNYDTHNQGFIPLQALYHRLNLDEDGHPLKDPPRLRTPIMLPCKKGPEPRPVWKAAREFALGMHKIRGPCGEGEDLKVEGEALTPTPKFDQGVDNDDIVAPEFAEDPTAVLQARNKIIDQKMRPSSRTYSNIDDIYDCLRHKFEHKLANLKNAFALFDLQNDGCVMRVDFRRVLAEFCCPLTALQLPAFVHRIGQTVNNGLISYYQLLNKLNNRSDPLVGRIIDDNISRGLSWEGPELGTQDDDIDRLLRSLVEHLHKDYILMASTCLRMDGGHRCVLKPVELKSVIEKVLGLSMTDKQWVDLKQRLPYDKDGNVRYVDFMTSFEGKQLGDWNQMHLGKLTVPKYKLSTEKSEEVLKLEQEIKAAPPPKIVERSRDGTRSVAQLRADLREFFTHHLDDVDRRFKDLDRKSHKRFTRWQFGAILRLCGFPITDKELADVWYTLKLAPDYMSTFQNVICEFSPNFTPFHARIIDGDTGDGSGPNSGRTAVKDDECEEKYEETLERPEEQHEHQPQEGKELTPEPKQPHVHDLTPSQYLTHLFTKISPGVSKYWDELRQAFRNADPHGFGSVTYQQMQILLDKLGMNLTTEERNQICSQFDFKSNGRCNYLAFMKTFTKPTRLTGEKLVYSPETHKLDKKPKEEPGPITVTKALQTIRCKMIRQYKTLHRAFHKHDRCRCGEMDTVDFKRVLKECGIPVSEEDLYHILSEFDANMNGKISYQEFLDTLLRDA